MGGMPQQQMRVYRSNEKNVTVAPEVEKSKLQKSQITSIPFLYWGSSSLSAMADWVCEVAAITRFITVDGRHAPAADIGGGRVGPSGTLTSRPENGNFARRGT